MQLKRSVIRLGILFWAILALWTAHANAEQLSQNPSGEAVFRGNYWRDRNTRVLNPTVDVRQDAPGGVRLGAHYLLDAITSASVAAGVTADQPFTELRHEVGMNLEVPLGGKHRLSATYTYSTESDYFSHQAGLRAKFSLLQDNTNLLFGADYSHNTAGKRLGPTGYLLEGVLQSAHLVALWTQVLSRRVLLTASYEVTFHSGFMNNPYRPVFVASATGGLERREMEHLPDFRVQHAAAVSAHILLPTGRDLIPHITLRPGVRVNFDSWGGKAYNPELATYVPVGPTELRLLLGFYDQYPVDFYRADGGGRQGYVEDTPSYANGAVEWGTTLDSNGNPVTNYVYTSDVKLGRYSAYTVELMLKWRLSVFRRLGQGPFLDRLSRTVLELSGGMWFADHGVGWQFGIPLHADDPQAPAGCSQICAAGYASMGIYVPL